MGRRIGSLVPRRRFDKPHCVPAGSALMSERQQCLKFMRFGNVIDRQPVFALLAQHEMLPLSAWADRFHCYRLAEISERLPVDPGTREPESGRRVSLENLKRHRAERGRDRQRLILVTVLMRVRRPMDMTVVVTAAEQPGARNVDG